MLKVLSVLFCCLGGHSGLYSYIVFRRPTVRSVESFGFRIFPRARSSGLPLPGFVSVCQFYSLWVSCLCDIILMKQGLQLDASSGRWQGPTFFVD